MRDFLCARFPCISSRGGPAHPLSGHVFKFDYREVLGRSLGPTVARMCLWASLKMCLLATLGILRRARLGSLKIDPDTEQRLLANKDTYRPCGGPLLLWLALRWDLRKVRVLELECIFTPALCLVRAG